MALAARKMTQEYVEEELIKAGINKEVAFDLSNRYYNSELTVQDLKITELKLENKIDQLDNKIDLVKADLERKIDRLENKFNVVMGMCSFILAAIVIQIIHNFFFLN